MDTQKIVQDLMFGKFINRLTALYPNTVLTDAQLYTLYKQCQNEDDFTEIVNNGLGDDLP